MAKTPITVKMWVGTLKKLRMIYTLTGENMVAILDRLITVELEKLQRADTQSLQVPDLPDQNTTR